MPFGASGPEETYPAPPLVRPAPGGDRYHPAVYVILGIVLIFIVWVWFKLEKDENSR